jgi:SAM-dependent methyltransferase
MDAAEYDRWYDTPRGRWIGQREIALLLGALRVRSGESALDVGCGTGYFTRALARALDGRVIGVDIDPAALEFARERGPGRASYAVADARALPFRDASFDLVVSVAALCFVDDERAAVREIVRVARRRIAIGLLNRHSLLWRSKGRDGGSGSYRGARWHSTSEALALFSGLPVQPVALRTAIQIPSGGRLARAIERLSPPCLHTGAFILVIADLAEPSSAWTSRGQPSTQNAAIDAMC